MLLFGPVGNPQGLAVLPVGFNPEEVHYGFSETKEMTVEHSWVERVYTQLYSPSGRSVTRIPSTQSESACSKPVSASGPLCHHSHLSLCPRHCHHSSLCSALLQPCSCATVFPRALGRALYCPQVCSELVNQGQVRILATGTFTLYTESIWTNVWVSVKGQNMNWIMY